MNTYRLAGLVLATCAAGLPVTACTAGISTASSSATSHAASSSSSPAASHSASAAASSPSAASSGRTITVAGSVGSFPVPAGARVVENVGVGQQDIVIFEYVTPARVSSFYGTALPQAGYKVSTNYVISQGDGAVALIEFTGHGFKGDVDALTNYPNPGVSIAGLGRKNVATVTFTPA